MSMDGPYLESGESIVLTTDRVSVDSVTYDAMLTTRRLILIDSRYSRFEPRTLSLSTIHSVRSGKAATGEPVILLSLTGDTGSQGEQRVIVFLQEPAENRKMDRDLWVRKFIELSVSDRDSGNVADRIPAETGSGIRPSVRRWVAPEIIRPHSDIITMKEPVPEFRIIEDEREIDLVPATKSPVKEVQSARMPIDSTGPESQSIMDNGGGVTNGMVQSDDSTSAEEPVQESGSEPMISRSILAATRSLIAAKVREEPAHSPATARIRTTSALPYIPQPDAPEKTGPETQTFEGGPDTEPQGGSTEVSGPVRISSPLPDIPLPPEPEQSPAQPSHPDPDIADEPIPEDKIKPDTVFVLPEPVVKNVSVPVPEPVAPPLGVQSRPGPAKNPLFIPGGIIILLVIALLGFMIFQASLPKVVPQVPVIPTITPTPVPTVTLIPATVPAHQDGVWVRFSSPGRYTGVAGNPGLGQSVSGTGEQFVRVINPNQTVMARAEKTENTGEELTITIFKNGRSISSRTTTAPMGSLELLIDPVTEQPPGIVTPVPTPETTRVGGGRLEYY